MALECRCRCDEWNRNRRKRGHEEVRELWSFEGRGRLNDLRKGDKIRVFSGEDQIDGIGVFIRIENRFFIWMDAAGPLNMTSLDAISVL